MTWCSVGRCSYVEETWTLERDFRELDSLAGRRDCLSLRRGDGDRMHAPFREGSGLCQAGHELTSASLVDRHG